MGELGDGECALMTPGQPGPSVAVRRGTSTTGARVDTRTSCRLAYAEGQCRAMCVSQCLHWSSSSGERRSSTEMEGDQLMARARVVRLGRKVRR